MLALSRIKRSASNLRQPYRMALLHEDVTSRIIKVFYDVYNELGHGFLERVCQTAMVMALREAGLSVEEKVPLAVWFRGVCIGEFEPDIIVNGVVLGEIKSGSALHPWHDAQVLNYLRASSVEVGMLLNFGPKPEHRRRILTNDRKGRRETLNAPDPCDSLDPLPNET
jgi:GxxExxY protein